MTTSVLRSFAACLCGYALLTVAACADSGNATPELAEEIAEEAGEFVEAIAPEGAEVGEVPVPAALTTPEETLTAIDGAGGLLRLAPAAATGVIDKWIGSLRAHPYVDDSEDLVADLEKLRALLAAPTIDGEAVGEVLDDLSDETEQAARDADSEVVARLADILDEAADALSE